MRTMTTINPNHRNFSKWLAWQAANPHVYNAIVEKAREAKSIGRRRWSMQGIFEVLRWEHRFDTKGDFYKMNQHWISFYSRFVMENEPDLAGFFFTKDWKVQ